MSRLVTFVTRLSTSIGTPAFRAVTGDMARLIAIVAWRCIRALLAVFCEVALSVAPITSLSILLAIPCKMAQPIAFVAFLPSAGKRITTATVTATPWLGTLTSEVARSTALVANAGTHCFAWNTIKYYNKQVVGCRLWKFDILTSNSKAGGNGFDGKTNKIIRFHPQNQLSPDRWYFY